MSDTIPSSSVSSSTGTSAFAARTRSAAPPPAKQTLGRHSPQDEFNLRDGYKTGAGKQGQGSYTAASVYDGCLQLYDLLLDAARKKLDIIALVPPEVYPPEFESAVGVSFDKMLSACLGSLCTVRILINGSTEFSPNRVDPLSGTASNLQVLFANPPVNESELLYFWLARPGRTATAIDTPSLWRMWIPAQSAGDVKNPSSSLLPSLSFGNEAAKLGRALVDASDRFALKCIQLPIKQ